jgi:hypothetical protein
MKGFTPTECRRFCSGRSIKPKQRSRRHWDEATTRLILIACDLQNPIEFKKGWNPVRDQGVGGSNPLSPTNLFKPSSALTK